MDEVIKEGTWKCPNCSARNRGRDVKCPSCGQARENVQFEYDENAAAVTDTAELGLALGGADWVCGYCATSNRASAPKCRQCGAEAGEGRQRQQRDVPPAPPRIFRPIPQAGPTAGGLPAWAHWVLLMVVAVFGLFAFLSSRQSERALLVESAAWERSIEIQKQLPVDESDWSLPGGATERYRRQEIHHHNRVQVGTRSERETYTERVKTGTRRVKSGVKDMGNGYFKETYKDEPVYENRRRERRVERPVYREDPVYRTKYYYTVMKWQTTRTDRAAGSDTSPKWPEVVLGPGEREGPRLEKYEAVLKDEAKGATHKLEPSAEVFTTLEIGGKRPAVFDGLGRFKGLKTTEK